MVREPWYLPSYPKETRFLVLSQIGSTLPRWSIELIYWESHCFETPPTLSPIPWATALMVLMSVPHLTGHAAAQLGVNATSRLDTFVNIWTDASTSPKVHQELMWKQWWIPVLSMHWNPISWLHLQQWGWSSWVMLLNWREAFFARLLCKR